MKSRFASAAQATILAATFATLVPSGVDARVDDCTYVVKKGDILSRIAYRHGVSERELIDTNAALKKNPNLLRPGQKLDVCKARKRKDGGQVHRRACGGGGTLFDHKVEKGETLTGISNKYGVAEKAILGRNKALKDNPNMLRVGQTLKICSQSGRARKSKACGYRTPIHRHLVAPGETLSQIAGNYGVRRRDLYGLNPELKQDPNNLRVGKRIAVCPEIAPRERHRITYTVQSGDTFGKIALRYGLSRKELERYQRGNLKNPGSLRPGQKLVVWVDGDIVAGFAGHSGDKGVLKGGIQLTPGRHYVVKKPSLSWGTAPTVQAIQRGVATYKQRMPGGPKVHVGDISRRGGGPFPPHKSHQKGRDADIGYVLKGGQASETRFRRVGRSNLDARRTFALIKALVDTGNVGYIFMDYKVQELLYEDAKNRGVSLGTLDEIFQYPRGRRRGHGIVRHWKGHTDHFHVRFRR